MTPTPTTHDRAREAIADVLVRDVSMYAAVAESRTGCVNSDVTELPSRLDRGVADTVLAALEAARLVVVDAERLGRLIQGALYWESHELVRVGGAPEWIPTHPGDTGDQHAYETWLPAPSPACDSILPATADQEEGR